MISNRDFRVYLDTLSVDDAQAIAVNANDKEIALNVPTIPYPYEKEHALSLIEIARQRYESKDEFHMGIHLLNRELIGLCALSSIDKTNRKAELGYWIGKNYWGHGYAKDALRLILFFGFERLDLNKIYAKVLTYNSRSINLLNSLGFSKDSTNREDVFHNGKFLDDLTFSMLKRDHSATGTVVVD